VLGYVQDRVLPGACKHVPINRDAVDANGLITDQTTVRAVTDAVAAVLTAAGAAVPDSQWQ
jgi:hypothetical protein